MFNLFKKLFNGEKKTLKSSVEYRSHSKYDGSIYRGMFLIDGNCFEGAYIRDGHPTHYTFMCQKGLCMIPRTCSFKQISKKEISIRIEEYLDNMRNDGVVPFTQLF